MTAGLLAVGVLALTHLSTPVFRSLRLRPRSRMLAAAGGISVAYVFVHLLPEIAAAQRAVDESARGLLPAVERHAYLLALVGFCLYYALERAAVVDRRSQSDDDDDEDATSATFWPSIGSFVLYNGIIGYLTIGRAEAARLADLAAFVAALGVHFVVNDLALRAHHRRRYDRIGRPALVSALFAGVAIAVATDLSEATTGMATAFLAGGIVLNVVKEELPEERQSRIGAFLLGAVLSAALFLAA